MNNTTVTEDLLRTASRFWLMKSEPGECSIDDALAAPGRRVSWFGIRNYQARNFMRDDMTIGDAVLFYHSSCAKPGIAGIARIASDVYPDELQFDPESEYYDPKSTKENPRWLTMSKPSSSAPSSKSDVFGKSPSWRACECFRRAIASRSRPSRRRNLPSSSETFFSLKASCSN